MKATNTAALETRVFDTLSDASLARTVWSELFARAEQKSAFSLPGWLDAWHQTIGKNQPLTVVVVFQEEQSVLAGAFVQSDNQIFFAGTGPTDYAQFLIDTMFSSSVQLGVAIDLLLATAQSHLPGGRWFRLGRIPVDARTFGALSSGKGRYQGVPTTAIVAPHMTMQLAPAAIKKKSLKRHENKLKRRGPLSITTHTDSAPVEALLPAFFDQHERRWATAGVASQFVQQEQRDFTRLCCKELARVGALRFTEIKSNDDVVAFHFGFSYDGIYTWYKPTFDPDFSEYSPGEVLLKALIEAAIADDANVFDFTIGNEGFKHRFADQYPKVSFMNVSDSGAVRTLFHARNLLRSTTETLRKYSSNTVAKS